MSAPPDRSVLGSDFASDIAIWSPRTTRVKVAALLTAATFLPLAGGLNPRGWGKTWCGFHEFPTVSEK